MVLTRRVLTSTADLATSVASALIAIIAEAQARGEVPAICLTGGRVADVVHREIARLGVSAPVDWSAVDFWWGDERYVEATSPERNDGAALSAFLIPLGVPAERIHAMPTTGSACSVEEGARAYAAELQRRGPDPFLVTMLGMGPDGHVASLFPGLPGVREASATAIAVLGAPKPPPQRISLTLPALNNSEEIWMLVSGADKADAVTAALAGEEIPAADVRGRSQTIWFLDEAAAS